MGTINLKTRVLPYAYEQLEYVQSSGTQYIDTGFKPNNLTTMEAIVAIDQSYIVGCCRWSGSSTYDTFGMYSSLHAVLGLASYFGRYSDNKFLYSRDYVSNTKIKWILSPTKVKINSVDDDSYNIDEDINQDAYQSTYNLWLFGFNNQGSRLVQNANGKIYYCKLYDDGTLVRNFVPARRISDSVVGMYDTVTETFYTNAGTGTFTAGPVIKTVDALTISNKDVKQLSINNKVFWNKYV